MTLLLKWFLLQLLYARWTHISYAVLAWGSAYKTHIDKIQTKQNHSARLIFFATIYGEQENWLENLGIISAPGFTKYKLKCYLFSLYISISVCMYKAKQIKV